jgi:hypothetical protein
MNKYPIYIVSKGRWKNPITAKSMLAQGLRFKIVVEPQEYEKYCSTLPKDFVLQTDFSNLGLGSFPARNFAWEHSIGLGYDHHWLFDDNIYNMYRLNNGIRRKVTWLDGIHALETFEDKYQNLGLTAFNYDYFVTRDTKKPVVINTHCYSAILIKNNLPFRWRLKYNEDVDLCLNALHNGWCTALVNAFVVKKVSTVTKLAGGNQTELYKGNAYEKKVLKARSLEAIWPQYAETRMRFNRPHHYVDWKKHFKHGLIKKVTSCLDTKSL